MRTVVVRILLVLALLLPGAGRAQDEPQRHGTDAAGAPTVILHYFWKVDCPYCKRAAPFLDKLQAELPWLEIRDHLLTDRPDNVALYRAVTRRMGEEAPGVPTFVYCATMEVGFSSELTSGAFLRRGLLACHERLLAGAPHAPTPAPARDAVAVPMVEVPLAGAVDPRSLSLPLVTMLLGLLDGLNPCTFFVLMFLLSLLVHERDRGRIALVGGAFALASGLVYFAYMAAWLNVFVRASELRWVTLTAGIVAAALATVNVKDYFLFGRGPSLSIPGGARSRLIVRMRHIAVAGTLPVVLGGTVTLAFAANTYGLLCTAGFPMVFSRLLAIEALSPGTRYGLLALYNVVRLLPLVALAAVSMATLGSRKLQRVEGRVLKLFSGLLMLLLGSLLVVRPQLLESALVAAGLVAGAAATTAAIHLLIGRRFAQPEH